MKSLQEYEKLTYFYFSLLWRDKQLLFVRNRTEISLIAWHYLIHTFADYRELS
jgi:hypothetical protein